MDNFNELKNIWDNQTKINTPDMETIKNAARKNRRQMVTKNLLSLVTLTATVIFIAYIGITADFAFISTRIGTLLIIISVIGAIVLNSQLLMLILNGKDNTVDNQAYLQQLIKYQDKQKFFQTTGMLAYYALMTIGFILYIYEFYARNHMFGLKAYALTLLWIAFAWFYLRPRAIKKQQNKINELIEQMKSVSAQLDK